MTAGKTITLDKSAMGYDKRRVCEDVAFFDDVTQLSNVEFKLECCHLLLCYCRRGHAQFEMRGQTLRVEEGELLFVTSQGRLVGKEWSDDLLLTFVHMGPRIYHLFINERPLMLQLGYIDPIVKVTELERAPLEHTLSLMWEIVVYPDLLQVRKMIATLLGVLFSLFAAEIKEPKSTAELNTRAAVVMDTFLRDLRCNYYKSRMVNFYAQRQFITVNYLNKCCKAAIGRSAQECINRHVLQQAKRLLLDERLIVKEVASALGFPNLTSFSKFYRNMTGISPSEYVKLNQRSN